MMVNINLDHERAVWAYKCIEKVKGEGSTEKRYHSAVPSSGVLIQNSGLLQTLSFYLSKQEKNDHYRFLAGHILGWIQFSEENDKTLEELQNLLLNCPAKENLTMYTQLLNSPEEKIRYKTQETKEFVKWLKRFADAMLESGV